MSKIRVILADDHALVRAGIRMLVEADPVLEVIGEVHDLPMLQRLTQELVPDIIIMETTLGGASSFQFMMELGQLKSSTRILVLTAQDDQTYWRSAVAVGVAGYVVKHATAPELIAAIHAVYGGRSIISVSNAARSGDDDSADPTEHLITKNLSEREREVLVLLAQGHTYEEIGKRLYISTKTVGTYRTRLAEKLGLKTRAEIVRYALEIGLLA